MSVAHDDAAADDTDDPYDAYTIQPGDDPRWSDELEATRESLVNLGRPMREVNRQVALQLMELRTMQVEEQRAANPRPPDTYPQVEGKNRIEIETWGVFRDHTDENIDFLVGGLIPKGSLVFLASQPKAGKTWLALSLAVSVAGARDYLERFPVHQAAPVLYLALEGHRTDYRTRLGIIARGHGIDPDSKQLENLHIAYQPIGLDLMDPAWAADLTGAITQTGAKIVFVDVLRNSAPKLREDGQGSSDFAVIRTHLQPILKSGVTVVLVHHFTKTNDSTRRRSIGEMMSGSGSLFGACDLIMGIVTPPKEWENMRVEFIGRAIPAPEPFRVQLVGEKTGKYGGYRYVDALALSTLHQDAEPAPRVWHHAEPMAKWISEQGRRVATNELVDRFRVAKSTIHDHVNDLERYGIVHFKDPNDNKNSGFEVSR